MDSSSGCDESSETDVDRSTTEAGCSTAGDDSLNFSRTISNTSSFSERSEGPSGRYYPHRGWPVSKIAGRPCPVLTRLSMKQRVDVLDRRSADDGTSMFLLLLSLKLTNLIMITEQPSELELVKEKLSKLLLGEDMSGNGKGVCTAVAISNAITNLYATVFGSCHKLEPLSYKKKSMWRREMNCLLSVCDYIVEFYPSLQTLPDGTEVEVMGTRPRSDIYINLPALEKLDSMLIEILDSFQKTEFWYVEEGKKSFGSTPESVRQSGHRNEEKWWLPVPCIPESGLSEKARKELQQRRDCANQIHKAAVAINNGILAEMEVPESYLAALPKSRRESIGDFVYRYMSAPNKFSPDYLLDCLDLSSEHEALEMADRVEAAMYVWRHKASANHSKSPWSMVKELVADDDEKNMMLANRAESLLLCLKQRFPALSQTTLDTSKIQYNKDVGQAILESCSRVLESLAFSIVSGIDTVLVADKSARKRWR